MREGSARGGREGADRSVHGIGPVRAVALVAARDEARRVGATVRALGALPAVERVVVVDDGSGDGTGETAREAGGEVLIMPKPMGKGGALNAGLATLAGDPYDVLLLVDADVGDDAHEMAQLIGAVARGAMDLAVARMRPRGTPQGLGVVKAVARAGVRAHGGGEVLAPLSGQRALKREVADALGGFAEGYAVEVDMTVRALDLGFRVGEVDTQMGFDTTAGDLAGFSHRARQLRDVLRALWRNRGRSGVAAGPGATGRGAGPGLR